MNFRSLSQLLLLSVVLVSCRPDIIESKDPIHLDGIVIGSSENMDVTSGLESNFSTYNHPLPGGQFIEFRGGMSTSGHPTQFVITSDSVFLAIDRQQGTLYVKDELISMDSTRNGTNWTYQLTSNRYQSCSPSIDFKLIQSSFSYHTIPKGDSLGNFSHLIYRSGNWDIVQQPPQIVVEYNTVNDTTFQYYVWDKKHCPRPTYHSAGVMNLHYVGFSYIHPSKGLQYGWASVSSVPANTALGYTFVVHEIALPQEHVYFNP